jgi:hypothetical protein
MDASGVNVHVSGIFGVELERHRNDGYIIARLGSSPDHDRVPPWLIEVLRLATGSVSLHSSNPLPLRYSKDRRS